MKGENNNKTKQEEAPCQDKRILLCPFQSNKADYESISPVTQPAPALHSRARSRQQAGITLFRYIYIAIWISEHSKHPKKEQGLLVKKKKYNNNSSNNNSSFMHSFLKHLNVGKSH